MDDPELLAALAADLPDLPRWVATRDLLLSGRGEVLLGPEGRRGAGYLVVDPGGDAVFAVGRPVQSLMDAFLASRPPQVPVLSSLESGEHLRSLLAGWPQQAATIHLHAAPECLPPPRHPVRPLEESDLAHPELPPALRTELARALSRTPVAAALDGERPVAFCYAAYESSSWWDISLDTLPTHRREGYATAATAYEILRRMPDQRPVWGAIEANAASSQMAVKYGFRAVDRLLVFHPPRGEPDDRAGGFLTTQNPAGSTTTALPEPDRRRRGTCPSLPLAVEAFEPLTGIRPP